MDTELASFDLATLSGTPLGAIRIPETTGLNYERRLLSDFRVSPDGNPCFAQRSTVRLQSIRTSTRHRPARPSRA
jgi:hypothetical protein